MATLQVSDLFIYRWRYKLSYVLIGLVCVFLLAVAALYVPGGLSEREVRAVATTNDLSLMHFKPEMAINLPYYLTQKASFYVFGVSDFSIKLPTIITGVIMVIGLVLLLKTWFKRNVAILTAIIGITTSPFLLAAQSGTPGILYMFWPIWLFYSASVISRRPSFPIFWKALFFIILAQSLYTPLSIYIVIALVSAAFLHPHLRQVLRTLSKLRIVITILIACVLLIPLAYSLYLQPSLALTLLGIPASIDLLANLHLLFTQYIDVLHPTNGIIMTPVYEVASILLAVVGVYRIVTAKYTARSYILACWLILLIPVLIVNPQLVNVTFLPFILITGYGVEFLIRYWYRLFPRNPYARIVGLVPIVIFITTLTLSGIDRFVYGYLYSPSDTRAASNDLSLITRELKRSTKNEATTLLVAKNEEAFYRAVGRYNPELNISNVTIHTPDSVTSTIVASHDALRTIAQPPTTILTSATTDNADRFYIYKNTSK
ncbi:MAG: conserved rane protein of unknown function [Candidatus Saccharibacteria bacterium]|nr:conserved rane protein of unknown function [Candidatus Saccharibacteria bacterium]